MPERSTLPLSPACLAGLPSLCHQFHVDRLDIFGSAVTGEFEPSTSDIDVLVRFAAGLTPPEYADAFFGLHESLERLFGRSVDLLTEQSLQNPYLRRRVLAERVPLFARA